MHTAPMSALDDGRNDFTVHMGDKSRSELFNYVLQMDKGDFFDKNDRLKENGMEYYKCDEWELKPEIKGTPPTGVEKEEGIQYMDNAIYAIDGERYAAQNVKGKVLKSVLTVYY